MIPLRNKYYFCYLPGDYLMIEVTVKNCYTNRNIDGEYFAVK